MARCLVDYLNSKQAERSLSAHAATIANIEEPERTPTFVWKESGIELALEPAFQWPLDPGSATREIGINLEPAFQPPPLDPASAMGSVIEKNLFEFVQAARRLSLIYPEAIPDETWVAGMLPMFIYCRGRIPKLQRCELDGCNRFFIDEKGRGKRACSPRHAKALAFQDWYNRLKKSPRRYKQYLKKKRQRPR